MTNQIKFIKILKLKILLLKKIINLRNYIDKVLLQNIQYKLE